jgi:hypothetical protein
MLLPHEKGNELERSVAAIEGAILRASPAYKESTFVIKTKKIITVGGVHHEIDIWVDVEIGHGYDAVFIFECKNWKDSVGKNEIIVFSEKIQAASAQRGFFAAKSFTKDAEAQVRKDPRIILLRATEHEADATPVPFDFHVLSNEVMQVDLELTQRCTGTGPRKSMELDVASIDARLGGQLLNLDRYVKRWVESTSNASVNKFPSGNLPEGAYDIGTTEDRSFTEGELIINDMDIETMRLEVKCSIRVLRPAVVSHYEVATRGRVVTFAPVFIPNAKLQFSFVETVQVSIAQQLNQADPK